MLIQAKGKENYRLVRKPSVKVRYQDSTEHVMKVTEQIARDMPDLGLPFMPPQARAAFRTVLDYEMPGANGCVEDILEFAQARGYCADPCDWVPSSEGDWQFPDLYQPWANWLAEEGYTWFYDGVRLTAENWDRWTPTGLAKAFRHLVFVDKTAAYDLLLTVGKAKKDATRLNLLREVGVRGSFYGLHPSDVGVVARFLDDPSHEVRALAREWLKGMNGLETEELHAEVAAKFFTVSDDGSVVFSTDVNAPDLTRSCLSTNLDAVASVLGLTAMDMVVNFDEETFVNAHPLLLTLTTDVEVRKILARRVVEAGLDWPPTVNDLEPDVWEKALRLMFQSPYSSAVFDFLGDKVGTLDMASVRQISHYPYLGQSIAEERASGRLPVNKLYDPLRNLALVASKDAAAELLDEALAAGIAPNNPRLTMLKYNLAL